MKRLTSKDIKKMQKDDVSLPDFYALSREFPLPDASAKDSIQGASSQSMSATALINDDATSGGTSQASILSRIASSGISLPNPATSGNLSSLANLNFLAALSATTAQPPQQQQQQQSGNSQSTLLSVLASLNHGPSQGNGSSSNNGSSIPTNTTSNSDANNMESRRNEILQRMMVLAATQGNTTSVAPQNNSSAPANMSHMNSIDLNSQMLALLSANNSNKHVAGGLPMSPPSMESVMSNYQQAATPAVSNTSAPPPARTAPATAPTSLNPAILSLLGQQSVNPGNVLVGLAQILSSNPSSNNNFQVLRELASSMNASTPQVSSPPPPGSINVELVRLLQQHQQHQSQASPSIVRSKFSLNNLGNSTATGNIDLAALLRQFQQPTASSNQNPSRSQTISGNAETQSNTILQQLLAHGASNSNNHNSSGVNKAPPKSSNPQTIDLASLMRLQQQLQQQDHQVSSAGTSSAAGRSGVGNNGTSSGGLDVNTLTHLLGDSNAALLVKLHQLQSEGNNQSSQTPATVNQGLSVGNTVLQRLLQHQEQRGNIQGFNLLNQIGEATNNNTISHRNEHDVQLLQQLMGRQQSNNANQNNAQNAQLEVALRALIGNNINNNGMANSSNNTNNAGSFFSNFST
jgi:hypothetical protein